MMQKASISVAMIGSRGYKVSYSGLETHIRELAESIHDAGCEVVVYGRKDSKLPLVDNEQNSSVGSIDGLCLGGKLTATFSNTIWATMHAIHSSRFDMLHFHGVGCVFAMLIARFCGIPFVLTLHSTNWQENKWSKLSQTLIHRLEKTAVYLPDALIVVSNSLASRIRDGYGVKACVIPNAVKILGNPDQDDEILRMLGLEKQRYVLHVGRIVPDKGCHTLENAFKQSGIPLKLVLAGPQQDQGYLQRLRSLATPDVVFPGSMNENQLGALYRNCFLFCSASLSEGQSIVVMEALAHGARCIASDIPAHRELVRKSKVLFAPEDEPSLCEILRRTWKNSKTEPQDNGNTGNILIQFHDVAKRTVEIYDSILKSRDK